MVLLLADADIYATVVNFGRISKPEDFNDLLGKPAHVRPFLNDGVLCSPKMYGSCENPTGFLLLK